MMETTRFSRPLRSAIGILSIVFLLSACGSSGVNDNETKVLYQAVAKDDTAKFKIHLTDKTFYGQMEILYGKQYKDSGDVNGIVKGDSLLGTYHFQHYGIEEWHRIPIALLKKDKKLIMGVGSMVIYMNMTFFDKKIPVDYEHPKFVFEKVH
jgi:hypothetical protein